MPDNELKDIVNDNVVDQDVNESSDEMVKFDEFSWSGGETADNLPTDEELDALIDSYVNEGVCVENEDVRTENVDVEEDEYAKVTAIEEFVGNKIAIEIAEHNEAESIANEVDGAVVDGREDAMTERSDNVSDDATIVAEESVDFEERNLVDNENLEQIDVDTNATNAADDANEDTTNISEDTSAKDEGLNKAEEDTFEDTEYVEPVVEQHNKEHVAIAKKKKSNFEKQKKRRKTVSRIALIIIWTIGLCLMYLCFSNLYQQMFNPNGHVGFFGIGEAIVASNSMEPKLCPNDLIFYKETDVESITVGDTIVYQKTDSDGNNMLIVHDVVQISDGYVTTQGRNNSAPDESFPVSAIVGKYMFKIGKIGAVLTLLSTRWAPAVIIGTMLLIFVVRIVFYCANKKKIIDDISTDDKNRAAINHFFEI